MDHYFDSHSVLLLWERLERKRLRQWLRLQQRLLLTGHDRAEGTESHWKNIEDLMERRRCSGASPVLSRRRV